MKEFSAVTLKYNENEKAPKITAKGKDKIAERILRIAGEAEIPVVNDSDLTEILYKFDIGDFISEELVTNFYTQGAGSFEVVERRELARVLKEQKLGGSGLLNKKTIAKVGEVLGIDAIVTGSIA